MHRNRTWSFALPEERIRNRTLPIEGGDGSTLSLDFTTGVFDPRLTLTRSSNATFINSSGLVQYAASNQQIYSEDQSQSGTWVRQELNGVDANVVATVDPQGGNKASKLRSAATLQAHLIYSTISTLISSGLAYTFSAYVKKAELKYVALHLASTARYTVVFDLDTGLMTTTNSTGTPLGTAYSSQDAGNGWWRLSATMITQTTTIYPHICLSNSATPAVNASGQPYYTGVLNDGVYTWGAQLNAGSTPLQYIATTTAQKFDQPRFDYDPTSIGTPRGLLIEGSAVNFILYSQDFSQATWIKSNATATLPTVAPDGTTTAYLLTSTTAAGVISQTHAPTGTTASTYSIYVKQGTAAYCDMYIYDPTASATRLNVRFTFATKSFTTSIGTNPAYQELKDGWFRLSVNPTALSLTNNIISYLYVGFAVAGTTYYAWGAQLEAGSGASSYIPTGASQGTRNPDYCVMNGISSFFTSQSSLTMLIDATPRFQSGFPALWRLTDAGNANSYELYYTSSGANNTYATKVTVGGVSSGESNFANSIAQDTRQIMGYAIASGVGFRSRNGASASAQIPTSLPSAALTRLGIGSSGLSSNPSTAHIRRIKYWPYAMTQDQLNGATTT